MNKRIIYKNESGGVSVIIPAPDSGLTIEQIAAKDVPAGKPYRIVDASAIPSDRAERGAWAVDEVGMSVSQIKVDRAKVSEIRANKIRAERDRLLDGSDWTQAADAPVDQVAWAAYRQALRNISTQAGFPDNVVWPDPPENN